MILAIDAALGRAGIAIADDAGVVVARAYLPTRDGLIETLPGVIAGLVAGQRITALAVTIGPGSFTGLRTTLALAQGYAAAAGIPLLGVTVAEAFAAGLPGLSRPLIVAIRARKNRMFLVQGDIATGYEDDALPAIRGAFALAGDAANQAAASLAARGADVMLTNAKQIDPGWVALAALARQGLAPHRAEPLYVDPPEAKVPGNLRAAPV